MGYYLEVPRNKGKVQQILDGNLLVPVNADPANPLAKFSPDMQWAKAPAYEAEVVHTAPAWEDIPEDKVLVVVVDNDVFEAAGVAYDEREYEAFTKHMGGRPCTYMLVDKDVALCASGAPGGTPVVVTETPDIGNVGLMAGLLALLSRFLKLFS